MGTEFVPISDLVQNIPDSFQKEIDDLEERISENDIPTWILVPDRNAGEHASGFGWVGVISAMCSSGENILDARIAWDINDRPRRKSSPGEVPDDILSVIDDAMETVDRDVNMCVLRLDYDVDTKELNDLKVGLEIITDEKDDKLEE